MTEDQAAMNAALEADPELFYTVRREREETGVIGEPEYRRVERGVREWRRLAEPGVVVGETVDSERVYDTPPHEVLVVVGVDYGRAEHTAAALARLKVDGTLVIEATGSVARMFAEHVAPGVTSRANPDGSHTHSFEPRLKYQPPAYTLTVPVRDCPTGDLFKIYDHIFETARHFAHQALRRRKRARARARGGVPSGRPHKRRK